VSTGGTATGTTLNSGGYDWVSGTAISTTVNSSGSELVASNATTSFTTVNRSGIDEVASGATAVSTTVNSGGTEEMQGTALSTTVNGGGTQNVYGAAEYATLSGGVQFVFTGTTTGTAVDRGGTEDVYGNQVTFGFDGGEAYNTTVNSGGREVVAGGLAYGTTVDSGGIEVVSVGTATDTTVNVGGTIDVTYLSYASSGTVSVTTSDVLTVSVGGHSYTQQLSGDYADEHFQLAKDTGSGTLVTAEAGAAPCYRSGTRILTDRGEVAVEVLRVGDLVRTVLSGTLMPIVWVGRREVDCARHLQPRKVWPVCVAAGAFGDGRPHSDLFLSPDHAVYVEDVLIPIRHLINGSTIVQVAVAWVTYCHLELAEHDVLLAEGLPAESFLDIRDGSNYANRPGPSQLYPDFSARMWEAFGCTRLIVTGPELAAARALVARHVARQEAA
jgi:autotransporter passenger strand-loop-strand repeat protein